jgi:hypothetical protein
VIVVAGDLSLVGGRDYPRTYHKFRSWFPDEWTCLRCSSRPLAPTRTPSPSSSAAPATTGTTTRRLSVNCTQADMQDVHSLPLMGTACKGEMVKAPGIYTPGLPAVSVPGFGSPNVVFGSPKSPFIGDKENDPDH